MFKKHKYKLGQVQKGATGLVSGKPKLFYERRLRSWLVWYSETKVERKKITPYKYLCGVNEEKEKNHLM